MTPDRSPAARAVEPLSGLSHWSVGRRRILIVAVAAVVVALDQVAKSWALHHARQPRHLVGTLRLVLTFNSGAAFGLGRGSTPIIAGGAIVLVVVLLGLGRRATRTANGLAILAMGLLLGGALGNLTDRLVRHNHAAVIDFIDLRWWPVFNLADASVTVGAVLLVLAGLRGRPEPDAPVSAGTSVAR